MKRTGDFEVGITPPPRQEGRRFLVSSGRIVARRQNRCVSCGLFGRRR